jgi:FkbM family methyltransferase
MHGHGIISLKRTPALEVFLSIIPDTETDFGFYSPSPFFKFLISLAQRSPHNWLGQQIAQIVRMIILRQVKLPIDLCVGSIKMRCFMLDNNSERKFTFMPWRFDGKERRFLKKILPRNGTFVDIGANVGIYTLDAATNLGAEGTVVAIEPNPPAFNRLCFNLKATQSGPAEWPKTHALQVGVSDTTGDLDLHLDPENLGSSSIIERPDHAASAGAVTGKTIRIPCKPLLQLLEKLSISRIDALKIDIEGAEDIALFSFLNQAPKEMLPDYIFMENNERIWKLDLVGTLRKQGYIVKIKTRRNTVYQKDKPA